MFIVDLQPMNHSTTQPGGDTLSWQQCCQRHKINARSSPVALQDGNKLLHFHFDQLLPLLALLIASSFGPIRGGRKTNIKQHPLCMHTEKQDAVVVLAARSVCKIYVTYEIKVGAPLPSFCRAAVSSTKDNFPARLVRLDRTTL